MSPVPHSAGEPARVFERVADIADRKPVLATSHGTIPGSIAARARGHHESFERRESHRRVDRRAASIAHNDAPAPRWHDTIRSSAAGRAASSAARRLRVRVRQAVEPEAPQPPTLAATLQERVRARGRGRSWRGTRCRNSDVRDPGQHAARRVDRGQARGAGAAARAARALELGARPRRRSRRAQRSGRRRARPDDRLRRSRRVGSERADRCGIAVPVVDACGFAADVFAVEHATASSVLEPALTTSTRTP